MHSCLFGLSDRLLTLRRSLGAIPFSKTSWIMQDRVSQEALSLSQLEVDYLWAQPKEAFSLLETLSAIDYHVMVV